MANPFEDKRAEILKDYFDLLRIPSIGADPTHLKECVQCAMWLKEWLSKIGFSGELALPPKALGTPPILFAERLGAEGAPTILFYGHYDVQPPDPLDQWQTPPFEPTLRAGRVYARGAQDDKGQFFAFLCGMREYLAKANPASIPTLKIVLEGQEESGSGGLTALAPMWQKRLQANILLVCDTSAAASLRPAIVAGLRGVSHFTVRLKGAAHDLHSGRYGGIAPNAAQAIAELVASLHNADGSVAVRGFYDHMELPTAEESALAAASSLTDEEYTAEMGVAPVGGETAFPSVVRNSFRPTLEVNGIHSGYGGAGSKTVIPAEALAKLSMRLVPGQSPQNTFAAVKRHLEEHTPRGMQLFIEDLTGEAWALKLPLASPIFRLASDVLTQMDARGPLFQWDGASIPVVSTLKHVSGAAPLLVGFGQGGDNIHAPNESFGLDQFQMAFTWAESILAAL